MNVLFIGNSYTYYNDMPSIFEKLAGSNGKQVSVCSVTKGGRRLLQYREPDSTTSELDELLAQKTFDICFIQEQSVLPAKDFEAFLSGLDCVVGKVKSKADRLILYATWGRKSGSSTLAENNWTTESMNQKLSEAYRKAAGLYDAQVSPAGDRFLCITQHDPEINLYQDDLSHPSYQGSCLAALTHYHTVFGEFPNQTGSLALSDAELSAFKAAICRPAL